VVLIANIIDGGAVAFKKRWRRYAWQWRGVVLPGLAIIALVTFARLMGAFESSELAALDRFSLSCPVSSRGIEPVVLVGISEADIQTLGGIPVSDQDLSRAVQRIYEAGARVIGLNLFRDMPVEPGQVAWNETLARSRQPGQPPIIGSQVVLNADALLNVQPPPQLSPERVGFVDVVIDEDGRLRRSLLAARDWEGQLQMSLGLRLSEAYLSEQDTVLEPIQRSTDPLRFSAVDGDDNGNTVSLPRVTAHSGGYSKTMSRGNQLQLNFCAQQQPLPFISFGDVLAGQFEPEQLRDRVVLVGLTAASVKDIFFTDALASTQLSLSSGGAGSDRIIYGVEYHGYTTRQIIQTALGLSPPLRAIFKPLEYVAIFILGLSGIALGIGIRSSAGSLLALACGSAALIAAAYSLLLMGWWLPVVPMLTALLGAGLITALFDRDAQFELHQRRIGVDQTYNALYNGPLQTLNMTLRQAEEEQRPLAPTVVREQFRALDRSLREIYERVRFEGTARRSLIYIDDEFLSVEEPITELLYQIHDLTLAKELPGFLTIETFAAPDFSALRSETLTLDERRSLCLFWQEALLNIGLHSLDATWLEVTCERQQNMFQLCVADNGCDIFDRFAQGREERHGRAAASLLRGELQHHSLNPHGRATQLIWHLKPKLWPLRQPIKPKEHQVGGASNLQFPNSNSTSRPSE